MVIENNSRLFMLLTRCFLLNICILIVDIVANLVLGFFWGFFSVAQSNVCVQFCLYSELSKPLSWTSAKIDSVGSKQMGFKKPLS